jgi:N-acetylglucosaminyldiphosphoundecaprenol N-acetyl-beta-D-mannosaminyltransferase
MKRIQLLNCPVDAMDMNTTLLSIFNAIKTNTQIHHVVVNAAKLVHMRKDEKLRESVVNCDIINADGQSVVWASKFLGTPLAERVAGIDLMDYLVELSHQKKYKIFLLGAKEEVVRKVAGIYEDKYGTEIIAGYRNGYYKKEDEAEIASQIAASDAQMLFVAITSPKKEIFLNEYKNVIRVPFIMGVGGSFDVIAGKTKRAPVWMQKSGLEWFYRVSQEPKRLWKRYLMTNSAFVYLVMKEKFTKKNKLPV